MTHINTLAKAALVAAMLLPATAMADTYEVLYGVTTTDASGNITAVANQTDFTGDANAGEVTFSDGNGNSWNIDGSALFANKSTGWDKNFSSPVTSGKVVFNGEVTVSPNNAKTFNIVDSKGDVIVATTSASGRNNGTYAVLTVCGTDVSSYVRLPRNAGTGYQVVIDLDSKKVNYTVVVSSGKNSTSTVTGSVDLPYTDVAGLHVNKTSFGCYLDDVALYSQQSSATKYAAVVNYQLDGTTVSSETYNVLAGDIVTAKSMVTGDNAQKYFITADEAPYIVASATSDNVLNVPVRKAYTATLCVTTTVNGTATTDTTKLVEADDRTCTWQYAYPVYVKAADGRYYKADNTASFGESGTFTDGETITKSVAYSKADTTVVFYSEEQTVTGSGVNYSNGTVGMVAAQNARNRGIYVGALQAGRYAFVAKLEGDNRRSVALRHAADDPIAMFSTNSGDQPALKSQNFTLATDTTDLYINGANSGTQKLNQSEFFDYVLIKKVPATVPVTINEGKQYTSFSSEYDLDFTGTALTAYVVSGLSADGSRVILQQVEDNVPANTGLIIKGSEGTTRVAVADNANAINTNLLVAATEPTQVASTASTTAYVFGSQDGVQGFYYLPVGSTATVSAGKAYLSIVATASAKPFVAINDVVTAINAPATVNACNAPAYNLAGQRVNRHYRGIVIVNGKKMINK